MIIHAPLSRSTRILKTLIQTGLDAASSSKAITCAMTRKGHQLHVNTIQYNLAAYRRVVCVGAGKASAHMARALEQVLGPFLEGGLVIVKDGYERATKKIEIVEAGHPLPDARSIHTTKRLLNWVQSLNRRDLLIVLLSGGASSLLCAPAHGLTLAEKRRTTDLLLQCGASIQEFNTVRKHLSAIKGGQLAQATSAKILTLIISDVIGDDMSAIGSGPTVPDATTFQEAKSILKRYHLWTKISPNVRKHLGQGLLGRLPETWKRKRNNSPRRHSIILANNHTAITSIAQKVKRLGLHPYILGSPLLGEAHNLGAILGALATDIGTFGNPVRPPACLMAGGEPTVTVKGKGKGGRAQECVLAAAQELAGLPNVIVAGFGTDGSDGPTEVAGAMVDGTTIKRAKKFGLDPFKILRANNSYTFFQQVGGHIITGPTRTNVNDIYFVLVL